MKTIGLVVITAMLATGCATSTATREPLLTPIPGVSTLQRLSAAKRCSDGLLLGGISAGSIAILTNDSVAGKTKAEQAQAATDALLEAKQGGIGQSILDACTESAGYIEQARAIRAGK